ncbi:AI-2E family transporter [Subtercola endophyticus]|uniref:AI-2E family transporter n=1 Tax=Subtercola endophyticus TaxID=2895559 RepID=UPI001E3818F1|nr:AI-2E family transporter [Subtercola endophyticus]UFS58630.1 AI-2E family transporter [Subtercola endophyticus]
MSQADADSDPPPAGNGLAPATRVLLTLGGAVLLIAGLSLGREVVGPFVLAAVLVIIVHPLRKPLERRGAPSWLATTVVIAAAFLILAVMIALLLLAAAQFVSLLRSSTGQLSTLLSTVSTSLQGLGIDSSDLTAAGGSLNPDTILGFAKSIGGAVLGVATAFFFILVYVIFMAADAAQYSRIPDTFARRKSAVIASMTGYTSNVRRYFVVNAIFGLVVAVLDGILLIALGVPGALIWTILAFVTNFIPNIGFVLGLIPAAVFALLFGGWVAALIVVAGYCIINVIMQELIQPKFVSDAVNLSLTLTFVSVIFWSFVIGPLGAILGVPLTLFVRELLIGTDPAAAWPRWLTGDRRAVDDRVSLSPGDDAAHPAA